MKTLKGLLATAVCVGVFILFLLYRSSVANVLWEVRGIAEGLWGAAYNYRAFNDLKLENESLKSELLKKNPIGAQTDKYLDAQVYSHYPFNDKNALIIDKGSLDGVKTGMPVLAARGVLLGRITAVKERVSEVMTIFDPAWKSSVVVGERRTKAVLQGANNPRLELIPKDAVLKEGDAITNISPEYPIALRIGAVGAARLDEKKVWQIADVEVAFGIEDVDSVLVVTNFP